MEGAGQVSTYRAGLQMGYLSLRNKGFTPFTFYAHILKLKLSDFLLDLHQSLAHQGLAKSLDIFIGMPTLFVPPRRDCIKILAHFLAKNSST